MNIVINFEFHEQKHTNEIAKNVFLLKNQAPLWTAQKSTKKHIAITNTIINRTGPTQLSAGP